jgi:type II secretory pathway pseudopilin PulG
MPVLSGWLWWVYNYQTLATGVLAVVAAIVTALALRNQTNNQRKIAEEAARHRTKAAIAALIAEVKAMKHHLIKTKNGAIALAQPGWEQNPEYIRQFHAEIPDIFKYYYRDPLLSLFVPRQKFLMLQNS